MEYATTHALLWKRLDWPIDCCGELRRHIHVDSIHVAAGSYYQNNAHIHALNVFLDFIRQPPLHTG